MSDSPTAGGLTRRHMLAALSAGTVVAAAEAAPAALARRTATAAPGVDLERGSLAEWSAMVGTSFRVASAPGVQLRLVAVEPVATAGPSRSSVGRRRGFAAVFETRSARAPEGNRTEVLAHGLSAPIPLFLSPPAQVSGKSRLVAMFS